jgi:ribose 5-phosphate isomerase A
MSHDPRNEGKRLSALKALEFVEDGSIVGVGTGSTVAFFIEGLAA